MPLPSEKSGLTQFKMAAPKLLATSLLKLEAVHKRKDYTTGMTAKLVHDPPSLHLRSVLSRLQLLLLSGYSAAALGATEQSCAHANRPYIANEA